MNYMKLVTLTVFGVLWMPAAFAGSKGFTAVFMNIGDPKFYESAVYLAFTNGFPDSQKLRDCWESRATGGKSFEWVIKKKLPEGLTQDMAKAVYDGNAEAAKTTQAILKKSKSSNGGEVDGMYVIKADKGAISVMALGSKGKIGPKNPSRKVVVPWNESSPEQGAADFDLALCKVSKPLDVGFSP